MSITLFILSDSPYGTERSGITEADLTQHARKSSLGELARWTREADRVLVW